LIVFFVFLLAFLSAFRTFVDRVVVAGGDFAFLVA
jgi:hypothetical protein